MATEVGDLFVKLGLKIDKPSWDSAIKAVDGIGGLVKSFVSSDGLSKLFHLVMSTVEVGDAAVKTAQKVGISIESVQELAYAAGQSGTSIDTLVTAAGRLGKSLVENIAAGKGPAIDALKSIGLSTADVKDKMSGSGGLDDILGMVADKFMAMEEGQTKQTAAMELFGKAGAELIPFLNSGSAGIAELRAEANELGIVIDGTTAKSMEAFGDDVDRLKAGLTGLKNDAVKQLLPFFQEMVTTTLAWVKANRAFLAEKVKDGVQALIFVMQGLANVVGAIINTIQFFKAGTEEADAAILALGVVIATFAAAAAIQWAIAFAPVIVIAAGLVVLALAIQDLWKRAKPGLRILGDLFDVIVKKIQGWIKDVRDGAGEIADSFNSWIDRVKLGVDTVKQWFVDLGESIKQAWEDAMDFIEEKAREILNNKIVRAAMLLSGQSAALEKADEALAKPTRKQSRIQAAADAATAPLAEIPKLVDAVPQKLTDVNQQLQISNTFTINGAQDKEAVAKAVAEQITTSVPAAVDEKFTREMRHANNETP